MGKIFYAVVVAALLGAAATASAAELTRGSAVGKVKSVDLMSHVVTLEDGSRYKIARGVNIKRIKTGQRVTLTTSKFGGTLEALAIAPAVD